MVVSVKDFHALGCWEPQAWSLAQRNPTFLERQSGYGARWAVVCYIKCIAARLTDYDDSTMIVHTSCVSFDLFDR
jgi:hypothetical protein